MKRILIAAACASVVLSAQEKKLKPADVPTAVSAALSKKYPAARVTSWTKEVEDGKTTYEASVTDHAAKRDVVFDEGGSLQAVEQAIPISELPVEVKTAVAGKYPEAVLRKAERITKEGEIQYEVDLSKATKKEVLLSAKGKVLKEE